MSSLRHDDSGAGQRTADPRALLDLIESLSHVLFSRHLETGVLGYISPECDALLGYGPDAFRDNPDLLVQLVHPDDRDEVDEALAQLPDGRARRVQFRTLHPTRGLRWVLSHWRPVFDDDGALVRVDGVMSDITTHKEAEAARQRLGEQLKHAYRMEAISALAAGIAHDFNNILAAMLLFTEMALMDAPAEGQLRSNLIEVRDAGSRARELVEQLSAFSLAGHRDSHRVLVAPMAKQATKMMRGLVPKGVDLRRRVSDEAAASWIAADPALLHELLVALALFASERVEPGGRVVLSVDAEDADGVPRLRLSLSDTGPSLDEGAPLPPRLAMAERLVRHLGGALSAFGSTVAITLLAADAAPAD